MLLTLSDGNRLVGKRERLHYSFICTFSYPSVFQADFYLKLAVAMAVGRVRADLAQRVIARPFAKCMGRGRTCWRKWMFCHVWLSNL